MKLRHKFLVFTSCLLLVAIGLLAFFVDRKIREDLDDTLRIIEEQSLASRRDHLRSVVQIATDLAASYRGRVRAGEISETEARRLYLGRLAALRYDNGIGYFWVHEYEPSAGDSAARILMHPMSPAVVGSAIEEWTDLERLELVVHDGQRLLTRSPQLARAGIRPVRFLVEANRVCSTPAGEGFVEYFWRKPRLDTGPTFEGYHKLSFVRRLPEWNWVIGSGIYLDDVEAELAAHQAGLDAEFREALGIGTLLVVVILALATLIALIAASHLTRPLSRLAGAARSIASGDRPVLPDDPPSDDEVGALQSAFRAMSEAIARREDDLREHTVQLEKLNADLQVLSRTKGMILANVSHELKTPLAAIRGYSELLRSGSFGPLNDLQREKLTHCIRNADGLVAIINEILSFAEAGSRVPGEVVACDLRELLGRATAVVAARASDRGIAVEIAVPDEPLFVRAEPERILQVLRHLLDNAVKFSHPGGRVRVWAGAGEPGIVEVKVRDEGVGIPPEERERVFSDFYQVDPSPSRKHGGLGLGLAIARVIVAQSGGRIRVEDGGATSGTDDSPRGTLVIVELPRATT